MTDVLLFEYVEDEETKEVKFNNLEAVRLVVTTKRRQSTQQLENRKHIQYILGYAFKEFSLSIDQTPETLDKINILRVLRTTINFYWKYSKYPAVYSVVRIDPNMSIAYNVGYLAADKEINFKLIENVVES
jgi:hypothetical protein